MRPPKLVNTTCSCFLDIPYFLHLAEIPTVMTSPIFWLAFRQATSIPVSYQLMLHFVHTSTNIAHLTFKKMTPSSFHAPKSSLLEIVKTKLPYKYICQYVVNGSSLNFWICYLLSKQTCESLTIKKQNKKTPLLPLYVNASRIFVDQTTWITSMMVAFQDSVQDSSGLWMIRRFKFNISDNNNFFKFKYLF